MALGGRTVDNGSLSAFSVAKQATPEGDAQAVNLVDETGAQVTIGSLATSANQTTGNNTLTAINNKITACDTGNVTIAGTVPVSGTFWQATQPVSGPLTDVQLRATPVPVSGTFYQATQPVSAASLPLPTDAATSANQSTIIGHVDGIQTSLTSIDGKITACNTGSIAGTVTCNAGTNLNTSALATESTLSTLNSKVTACNTGSIAGTVTCNAGTNLNTSALATESTLSTLNGKITACNTGAVTISAALPTGTNAIGKLAANSGVDIGDVDITTVTPGTGATNLGKAEDAGHTTGDVGVMALGVRNDTPNTALAGTDLDYSPIALYRDGSIRRFPIESDFAVLGGNQVKKYYTNAGAVTDGIVWSPAAGKRWYVTDIFIGVSAAATVTLEDDKAGGDEAVWKMELAANSGWSHSFETPLFSGEDAADLLVTTSAGNVYITITGYEI